MTKNIVVAFRLGRESGEVVGEAVAGTCARKICLVERAYRGTRPQADEAWLCSLVQETNPGQRNGTNIVRPTKRLTWRMVQTGERVADAVQYKLHCVEWPGLADAFADKATRQQIEARNASYQAARRKAERFASAPWGELPKEYGAPVSVVPTEGCATYFVVTFPGGRVRKGYAEEVSHCLPKARTATGAWRWRHGVGDMAEAEYANDVFPVVKTWEFVASTHGPPKAEHSLPEATRVAIVEAIRAKAESPEQAAEACWNARPYGSESSELARRLVIVGSPGTVWVAERSSWTQIDVPASPDEYRPAGTIMGHVNYRTLTLNRYAGKVEERSSWHGGWGSLRKEEEMSVPNGIDSDTSEAEIRARATATWREELEKALALPKITLSMAPHRDYRPEITDEEWLQRAQAHLLTVAQVERERLETQIRDGIAAAQAEYDEYHRLAAEIITIRQSVQALETRCMNARFDVSSGWYGCHLGWDDLADLQKARDFMAAWIATTEERLAQELRRRGEQEIAAQLDKEARAKALADAMSAPATPTPWYVVGMSDEEIKKLTGRTFGEGIGPRVAGHTNKFLPGDQPLVAIRVGGGSVNRYSFRIAVSGLVNLWGPNSAFYESAGGRHATDILGLVEAEDWYVAVTNLERGEAIGYVLYTKEGVSRITPRTWEDEDGWHSNPWDDSDGEGPSERRVREVFGLMGGGVTPKPQPTPEPAPPPVEATPAAPAQVAATLDALKARFSKGGKNKR